MTDKLIGLLSAPKTKTPNHTETGTESDQKESSISRIVCGIASLMEVKRERERNSTKLVSKKKTTTNAPPGKGTQQHA